MNDVKFPHFGSGNLKRVGQEVQLSREKTKELFFCCAASEVNNTYWGKLPLTCWAWTRRTSFIGSSLAWRRICPERVFTTHS